MFKTFDSGFVGKTHRLNALLRLFAIGDNFSPSQKLLTEFATNNLNDAVTRTPHIKHFSRYDVVLPLRFKSFSLRRRIEHLTSQLTETALCSRRRRFRRRQYKITTASEAVSTFLFPSLSGKISLAFNSF